MILKNKLTEFLNEFLKSNGVYNGGLIEICNEHALNFNQWVFENGYISVEGGDYLLGTDLFTGQELIEIYNSK